MKARARVKATKALVEVEYNQFDQLYCDKHRNKTYFPSDLDLDVPEGEEVTVEGWVARDQDGFLNLFTNKPERDYCDKNDICYGFWDALDGHNIELPIDVLPTASWESDPLLVTITIKGRKK